MTDYKSEKSSPTGKGSVGPFIIYSAGGLFTQDELATNVLLKEAVWRLSNGKFQLFLPQSREVQELKRPDIEAHIRNTDLLEVMKADMLLCRFDGPELDSGTVMEYAMAKFLGKPAVLLRCDFRQVVFIGTCGPYNSMVKNWPRTVEIQVHSFQIWGELLSKERHEFDNDDTLKDLMKCELSTLQASVDEIAEQVISGLEAVITMPSPYPTEYQDMVYHAARYSLGSGFDHLLSKKTLDGIIQRLRNNGTL